MVARALTGGGDCAGGGCEASTIALGASVGACVEGISCVGDTEKVGGALVGRAVAGLSVVVSSVGPPDGTPEGGEEGPAP